MPSQANAHRSKRCRTGCLKCRSRRRKCLWPCCGLQSVIIANILTGDEGKPRCQNCVVKNFECRYGKPLTFLAKNTYTVLQPNQHENSGTAARPRYANLEVVCPTIADCASSDKRSQSSRTISVDNRRRDLSEEVFDLASGSTSSIPSHEPSAGKTRGASVDFEQQPSSRPEPQEASDVEAVNVDRYESALDALMALGRSAVSSTTLPATIATASPLALQEHSSPTPVEDRDSTKPADHAHANLDQSLTNLSSAVSESLTPGCSSFPLSPRRTLDLLRHFRYEVAPWVSLSFVLCNVHF